MSTYVMSDIHGHLKLFKTMLEKIGFKINSDDTLYLLGDYADFGEANAETLFYIMKLCKDSNNVKCLLGNHDLMLLEQLKYYLETEDINTMQYNMNWLYNNGGAHTFNELLEHSKDELIELAEWLDNLPYRVDIEVNSEEYTLVHASPTIIVDKKDKRYDALRYSAVWSRVISETYQFERNSNELFMNYRDLYEYDKLIIGHTIVSKFQGHGKPYKIQYLADNTIIDIDCGCKIAGNNQFMDYENARLAALRLDDLKEYYVK